jgi:fused signal recognition particle receptor
MLKFLKGSYDKVRSAMGKTRSSLGAGISRLFSGKVDEEALQELEALFFQADLGVETSLELVEDVRQFMRKERTTEPDAIIAHLQKKLLAILQEQPGGFETAPGTTVVLIVGVNGNGKTTSVAKLGKLFRSQGETVILAAADTFRAAAIDQLQTWAERIDATCVSHQPGSDPAAVAFDAVTAGLSRRADKVLIDTAGRLHTKTDLMHELAKIRRVCEKVLPGSPHETLLVLDATTGQNAIEQAKVFHQFTPITGVILTKLDGTAKGGVILPIQRQLGVPVKFVGVGEGVDDLQPFDPEQFVASLF